MNHTLSFKPDLEECLDRVNKWLHGEKTDRPPVRFSRHNAEFEQRDRGEFNWQSLKDRWFDTDYQIRKFEKTLPGKKFHAETFPVFWPNLGPNVFAACYGCRHEYGEVTAWAEPSLFDEGPPFEGMVIENGLPMINWQSDYIQKLDEMTKQAIERSDGRYMVGYTDLHPGLDFAAALRGTEQLLYDVYDQPDEIIRLTRHVHQDFLRIYERYDSMLKHAGHYSVSWLNVPASGRLHIPSCDFASMISQEQFIDLAMNDLAAETTSMDINIFHVDGPGVARHLDQILTLPKLNAIQWVQGVAEDAPIMQWVPMIKKVQTAGKGIMIDLSMEELNPFMKAVEPQGIFLCIATDTEQEELEILERLKTWH